MQETGLLEHIIPELEQAMGVEQPGGYHAYDVFEHIIKTVDAAPQDLIIRLAAIFHDITKPRAKRLTDTGATFYGHEKTGARVAKAVLKRLRYSSEIIKNVITLVERHMFTTEVTDKGLRRLVRKVGIDLIFDLLDLRRADVEAQGMGGRTDDVDEFERRIQNEIEQKAPFGVADLAVNGNDIMEKYSLPESPVIGEILEYLVEKVLDDPADNTTEKLYEYAKAYLDNKEKKGKS
jgi:tRNA nucleotidyltransferase (CCA-adding enzyme)